MQAQHKDAEIYRGVHKGPPLGRHCKYPLAEARTIRLAIQRTRNMLHLGQIPGGTERAEELCRLSTLLGLLEVRR